MKTLIEAKFYNKIVKILPIACVDICFKVNNKILLIKRNDPVCDKTWWLPGGRIHIGETVMNAAERKLREEVGLEYKDLCKLNTPPYKYPAGPYNLGFDSTIFKDWKGKIIRHSLNAIVMFHFFIKEEDINVVLDDTSSKWAWDLDILPQKGIDDYVHRWSHRARNFRGSTF